MNSDLEDLQRHQSWEVNPSAVALVKQIKIGIVKQPKQQHIMSSVCPTRDEMPKDMTTVTRYLSLVALIIWLPLLTVSVLWWLIRRRHPFLRKRSFGLMIAGGLGLSCNVVLVSASDYFGAEYMPCDLLLWCNYLLVCLGAGPMAVRLAQFYASVRFGKILLHQAQRSRPGELRQFGPVTLVKQLGAVVRVLPYFGRYIHRKRKQQRESKRLEAAALATALGQPTPAVELEPEMDSDTSDSSRSSSKAHARVAFFLQSRMFSGSIVFILLLMGLIPGVVLSVQPDSPYGLEGCRGCTLDSRRRLPMWIQGVIVLVLGSWMLWNVRKEPDPLYIVRELLTLWFMGIFMYLILILGILDVGALRDNGTFDYHLICVFVVIAMQVVQGILPVAYTYTKHSFNQFKSTYKLEDVLTQPDLKHVFAEYLASEFSMENLLFLDAVQRYKDDFDEAEQGTAREIAVRACDIFDTFLREKSMLEVNVSSSQRRSVREALTPYFSLDDITTLETPPKYELFNACEEEILNLLRADSFPRFLRSDLFDKWFRADQLSSPTRNTAYSNKSYPSIKEGRKRSASLSSASSL